MQLVIFDFHTRFRILYSINIKYYILFHKIYKTNLFYASSNYDNSVQLDTKLKL